MSTLDNIVEMDKDRLKDFICNSFKTDKLKTDVIKELEYRNKELEYRNKELEYMMKVAYCKTIGSDSIIGLDICDNYKDWKSNLINQHQR